ncbi:MAG TPA: hypothetical protein VJ385_23095 [Fibrobacteria bacterium]|nr:hypothetical protein [Fibrobacteria bacterium]
MDVLNGRGLVGQAELVGELGLAPFRIEQVGDGEIGFQVLPAVPEAQIHHREAFRGERLAKSASGWTAWQKAAGFLEKWSRAPLFRTGVRARIFPLRIFRNFISESGSAPRRVERVPETARQAPPAILERPLEKDNPCP